jgi:hypothetical protein
MYRSMSRSGIIPDAFSLFFTSLTISLGKQKQNIINTLELTFLVTILFCEEWITGSISNTLAPGREV